MGFPKGFVWGAAAASHQIEGGRAERGENVWDMFCRKDGTVFSQHHGDVACDHYHRWAEDVDLMAGLGLHAYRLSISWPRVLPDGTGAVNEAGLAFYDKLIDALLAKGIQPWVTLFHWDLPLALYRRGGWGNREIVDWFTDYTAIVAKRLGDRVKHWMTFNEPQCFIGLGQLNGIHAPGDKLQIGELTNMTHNVLLAHGSSVKALRAGCRAPVQIGWAPVGKVNMPAEPGCEAAAMQAMAEVKAGSLWSNTWWSDPVYLGRYPDGILEAYGHDAPRIRPGDLELIHQPLDFCGVNIYNGTMVRPGPDGKPVDQKYPQGGPMTSFHWPVTPSCLYWGAKFLYERYRLPVVITENGLANPDWVALDGAVHDPQRIDFTARYLRELRRAADDGVKVGGYFHWSVMDNFEWAEGYKHRFGLIHVDYQTQKRTPKDSYHWYREVIKTNGSKL